MEIKDVHILRGNLYSINYCIVKVKVYTLDVKFYCSICNKFKWDNSYYFMENFYYNEGERKICLECVDKLKVLAKAGAWDGNIKS